MTGDFIRSVAVSRTGLYSWCHAIGRRDRRVRATDGVEVAEPAGEVAPITRARPRRREEGRHVLGPEAFLQAADVRDDSVSNAAEVAPRDTRAQPLEELRTNVPAW